MWKVLQAIALFATAGLIFAKNLFNTVGVDADSPIIIAIGLGVTTMLMYRSVVSLLVMILFLILVNLPPETLDNYNLDKDMLLAAAIATLFLPWLQRLGAKS